MEKDRSTALTYKLLEKDQGTVNDDLEYVVEDDKGYVRVSEELFENEFMTDKKHTMVLMPLYFRDTLYGSVLYDLTDISFKSGDLLANEYSTVARVIDMLNK